MTNNENKRSGFTLIELLVNIMVIGLLLSISFWGYKQRQEGLALRRSSQKLVLNVEKTREMGMSAREFKGVIPKGGYGAYFSSTQPKQYILFADLNNNQAYDGPLEKVETISLENNVYIKKINPFPGFWIIFKPPSPDVTIKTLNGSVPEANVILGAKHISSQRKIWFNSVGLVTTEK